MLRVSTSPTISLESKVSHVLGQTSTKSTERVTNPTVRSGKAFAKLLQMSENLTAESTAEVPQPLVQKNDQAAQHHSIAESISTSTSPTASLESMLKKALDKTLQKPEERVTNPTVRSGNAFAEFLARPENLTAESIGAAVQPSVKTND